MSAIIVSIELMRQH